MINSIIIFVGETYEVIPEESIHLYEFIKDTRLTQTKSSSPDYPAPSETPSAHDTHMMSDVSSADTSDNDNEVAKGKRWTLDK